MTILSPEHRIPDHGPWLMCCGCFEETHEDEATHFNGEDYCERCWEDMEPCLVADFVSEMADCIDWLGSVACRQEGHRDE